MGTLFPKIPIYGNIYGNIMVPIKQPSEFHDVPIVIGLFSWPQWLWLAETPFVTKRHPQCYRKTDLTALTRANFSKRARQSAWNQFYYHLLPHDPHVCRWILLISIDGVYIIYVDAIWYPL
jgi:hypothetical protein